MYSLPKKGKMYDKVKIWAPRTSATPDIAQYLSSAKEQRDMQTGETIILGYLDGLRVNIFNSGISIIGSLAKYIYPYNTYTLDRNTTKDAIIKLSESLQLDFNYSKVTGLEFGTQFIMKHNVNDYLSRLGNLTNLKRSNIGTSLYYSPKGVNQSKVLCFYDKNKEVKEQNKALPIGFEEANLLRYELRFNNRLKQHLKVNDITPYTLYDEVFYKQLINQYQDNYFSIKKQTQLNHSAMDNIRTVSDAFNCLVARLINQCDKEQVNNYLEELKASNVFADPKYYTRFKNKINEVSNKSKFCSADELIKELDNEVKNVGLY